VGYSLKVIILPDEDAGGLVLTSSTTFEGRVYHLQPVLSSNAIS